MPMKHIAIVTGILLAAGSAFAQQSTVNGAAGGAVTGAIVGGPAGAAVGGVVGAVAGTAIDPPPERVVTYVREAPMPADPVVVQEKVVVGEALPSTVVIKQRLIVEPSSRKVIQVIN